LLPGEIHIWQIDLDLPESDLGALSATLQPEERQRAARFRFAVHRNRFIARRGQLRQILGSYLGEAAPALRFEQGPHGKPHVLRSLPGDDLHFNLSDAGPLALIAVTHAASVGIDVEIAHPDLDIQSLAERFFAPREVSAIQALPTSRRPDAFYACWTRKEAYSKALGVGLSLPLDSFAVSVELERPALLWDAQDPEAPRRWRLYAPATGPEVYAALAVARHDAFWTGYRWQRL
jgi:4'-phosphopantetheinyl transferase